MPVPGIKTRPPTGRVPLPCILVEGEEKAGKTWEAIRLSASEHVSETFVIDVGEGSADEYGAIPGARFEVVEHDGSYREILFAVEALRAYGAAQLAAGEKPIVVVVDTATLIWDGLKDWTSSRAAKSDKNKRLLAQDPNAELLISQNLWNDAGARWRKLQTILITFPGIVVITARGKEVVEVKDGRPVEGSRVWSVQTHKELPYSATVWLRMHRDAPAEVIGARSVKVGIRPGRDKPEPVKEAKADERLLEWLIFDVLGVEASAPAREVQNFEAGDLLPEERAEVQEEAATSRKPTVTQLAAAVSGAETEDGLRAVWNNANRHGMLQANTRSGQTVEQIINTKVAEMRAAAQPAADPDSATPDPENTRVDTSRRKAVLASLESAGIDDDWCRDRWYLTIAESSTERLHTALEQELQNRQEHVGA